MTTNCRRSIKLLADTVLHHLLVQQQVDHKLLQLAVFILQLINRFVSNGINPAYFLRQL